MNEGHHAQWNLMIINIKTWLTVVIPPKKTECSYAKMIQKELTVITLKKYPNVTSKYLKYW